MKWMDGYQELKKLEKYINYIYKMLNSYGPFCAVIDVRKKLFVLQNMLSFGHTVLNFLLNRDESVLVVSRSDIHVKRSQKRRYLSDVSNTYEVHQC